MYCSQQPTKWGSSTFSGWHSFLIESKCNERINNFWIGRISPNGRYLGLPWWLMGGSIVSSPPFWIGRNEIFENLLKRGKAQGWRGGFKIAKGGVNDSLQKQVWLCFQVIIFILKNQPIVLVYDLKSTLHTALPKLPVIIDKQLTCMRILSS